MRIVYHHRIDVPFKYGEYSHAMLCLSEINSDSIECDESKILSADHNESLNLLRIRLSKPYVIVWK